MAKKMMKRGHGKKTEQTSGLPFTKTNYYLFGAGLLVLVLGYLALSKGPWDSFWSLSLAPILLVFGYCVMIPVAILYKKKQKQEQEIPE